MTATRTISVLLKIMADVSAPIRQRIQAAENLLSFESPEDVVARTKSFLLSVLESKHVALSDRLEATKLMRKCESPKVTQQTVRTVCAESEREFYRQSAIGDRCVRLSRAGLWPCPSGWDADLEDPSYEPGPRLRSIREAQPAGDRRRDD
jgi:hypothetical protein